MSVDPKILQDWINLLLSPAGIGFLIYMLFRAFNQEGGKFTGLTNQVKLLIIFVTCEVWALLGALNAGIPQQLTFSWVLSVLLTGGAVLISNQVVYALAEQVLPVIKDVILFLKSGEVPSDPPVTAGPAA